VGSANMSKAIQNTYDISRDSAGKSLARAIEKNEVIKEKYPEDKRRTLFRLPTDENIDEENDNLEDLF
jgi:hypothetical protein